MKALGLRKMKRQWVLVAAVIATLIVSWSGYIDRKTESYVDRATVQALAAFATARALNATITVAKSAEVASSIGVASVSIQPLEILDPLHDLVEQYSSVMKVAIASLVIQKLLLGMVSTNLFNLLFTAIGTLLVVSLFVQERKYSRILIKCFLFAALVRFLFVFTLAANAFVDQAYVNRQTEKNMSAVQVTASEIQTLSQGSELDENARELLNLNLLELNEQRDSLLTQMPALADAASRAHQKVEEAGAAVKSIEKDRGLIEANNPFTRDRELIDARSNLRAKEQELRMYASELRAAEMSLANVNADIDEITATLEGRRKPSWIRDLPSRAMAMVDIKRFEGLGERASNIIPNILNLIALFVLKTLIMPVVFLMLLLRGFRYIWGSDLREVVKAEFANIRGELGINNAAKLK